MEFQKPSGKPLHHQSPEQHKMKLQRPSGKHFATRAGNSSKWASRGHLEALLLPEPGTAQNRHQKPSGSHFATRAWNTSNEPLEVIWEHFCYQTPEQLKMSLQRPPGSPFVTRARNTSKSTSRGYLGRLLPPELATPQNERPEV